MPPGFTGVGKSPKSQPLQSPLPAEITSGQAEILENNAGGPASLGFDGENFGERSHLARAVPAITATQDPAQSLVDALDWWLSRDCCGSMGTCWLLPSPPQRHTRTGKSPTDAEMGTLLEHLAATNTPQACPHGRLPGCTSASTGWSGASGDAGLALGYDDNVDDQGGGTFRSWKPVYVHARSR